ncbi:ribosome maturation factor RimM [Candidatus Halobeggiatoa sp. HSG11]|nr:ribosome maturation factor RimM [Candidatus Halobeggiatoa sp. HSG11]
MPDLITVGRINGLYGVKGWLKIFSYTDPISNILDYSPWLLQGQTLKLQDGRLYNKGIIAKFDSIDDRDIAAQLLDLDIMITREQLPVEPEDEYYWTDLEGLTVINQEGINLGQIDHMLETGANDVAVVKGERQRMIPFVLKHVITKVDLTKRILLVDWDADF